ncbi:MAG: lipid II flippase MurJ, partial [Roseovarius sp.]|nr:lipid II flippase MurJ [Roseovarius sp.]
MKPVRLLSGILTVGGWTLLSRMLGFVRDVMIASYLGPGVMMDSFVAAFRLPDMFRRFFAEGAFNAAFVPMFSRRLEADEDALGFASLALSGLGLVLLQVVEVDRDGLVLAVLRLGRSDGSRWPVAGLGSPIALG